MNMDGKNDEDIISRLKQYRLASASPVLRARVLAAARRAWVASEQPANDAISWPLPVFRLICSMAATILLVFLAHTVDSASMSRRPAQGLPCSGSDAVLSAEIAAICGDRPLVMRLACAATSFSTENRASLLRKRQHYMNELLGDLQKGV